MIKISTEKRRSMLRNMLKERPLIRIIETVNGLEGIIAENTKAYDESGNKITFDALWLSGFCHAAFKGKPDNELVDISEKISAVNEIFNVTSKPLIIDMDTGGLPEHLCRHAVLLERLGVSAIVIEDKAGLKRNSLYGSKNLHLMEDADVFSEKIRKVKNALCTNDFMIFARIESLISGETIDTAMLRAKKYIDSGADGIVIHSICQSGSDIFTFAERFKNCFANVPLIFIPTAYNKFTDTELHEKGADIIIYANQLMRSAYLAMQKTALSILKNRTSLYADENYCESPQTILNLIDGEEQ